MAMNFAQANRAATPPLTEAYLQQHLIANQLRQAEQERGMMTAMGAGSLAGKAPEGSWGNLGNALTGTEMAGAAPAGAETVGATMIDPVSGAVASGLPEATTAAELFGMGGASAAPSAGLGAGAAEAALAATEGLAATGAGAGAASLGAAAPAAAPGAGAALAGLGPMGWAALLGLGLAGSDLF